MQIEKLKTSDLVPYARNPREHSEKQVAQIAASIREFGFNNPVLVNSENTVIAGHGRLEAARLLKIDEVPCVRLEHLTPTQAKAYGIIDNQLTINSDWDNELLRLEIEDLKIEGMDMDLLGFDDSEMADLFIPESANGKEFDESCAGKVEFIECPECHHKWPK